jgi:hypothetical protein
MAPQHGDAQDEDYLVSDDFRMRWVHNMPRGSLGEGGALLQPACCPGGWAGSRRPPPTQLAGRPGGTATTTHWIILNLLLAGRRYKVADCDKVAPHDWCVGVMAVGCMHGLPYPCMCPTPTCARLRTHSAITNRLHDLPAMPICLIACRKNCPFAHPNERARRRDPYKSGYFSDLCNFARNGTPCPRGDLCSLSHNTFEMW